VLAVVNTFVTMHAQTFCDLVAAISLLYKSGDRGGRTGPADQAATRPIIISKSQEQIEIND